MKQPLRHIYIIGAKSIGQYGGFETFVDRLTELHQNHPRIRYHVACKANGDGHMEEERLPDPVKRMDARRFCYHNAECFKIRVPQIGAAQAVYYDLAAFRYAYREMKKRKQAQPVLLILACRIGPFMRGIAKKMHRIGGKVMINPDGQEWRRAKWPAPVKRYWKWSERYMVKYADHVICDSREIERYIRKEYGQYHPETSYIPYGADII